MDAGKGHGDLRGAARGLLGADFVYIDAFDIIVTDNACTAIFTDHHWLGIRKVTGILRQRRVGNLTTHEYAAAA